MEKNIKEKILMTSFRMFLQNGYNSATLRAIAEECHTTHANILYYFKGKGEIADAFINMYFNAIVDELNRICEENDIRPSAFKLTLFWTVHLCFMAEYPDFARTYIEILSEDRDIVFRNLHFDKDGYRKRMVVLLGEGDVDLTSANVYLDALLITDADYRIVLFLKDGEITLKQGAEYMADIVSAFVTGKKMKPATLHRSISMMLDMVDKETLNNIAKKCMA